MFGMKDLRDREVLDKLEDILRWKTIHKIAVTNTSLFIYLADGDIIEISGFGISGSDGIVVLVSNHNNETIFQADLID